VKEVEESLLLDWWGGNERGQGAAVTGRGIESAEVAEVVDMVTVIVLVVAETERHCHLTCDQD
jgi:hypothetical protein